jgi:hypothetical protein
MGNFEGSNRSRRWHWLQPRKGRRSDTDDHLLTCQQGFLGIFRAAWKSEIAKKPTSPRCLKCGEQPKFITSMLDPPTGREISQVRMPVRQLDLDREGLTRLSLSAICPAPSRHLRAERNALGTSEAGAVSTTEVRNYRGVDPDGVAQTESDHFMKCPGCGEWFDMRYLGACSRRGD